MASYVEEEVFTVRGHDPKDKRGWDGVTFPYFEPTKAGFVVHASKSVTFPGIYTDERLAQVAYNRYRGNLNQAQIAQKKARELKKAARNKKG